MISLWIVMVLYYSYITFGFKHVILVCYEIYYPSAKLIYGTKVSPKLNLIAWKFLNK